MQPSQSVNQLAPIFENRILPSVLFMLAGLASVDYPKQLALSSTTNEAIALPAALHLVALPKANTIRILQNEPKMSFKNKGALVKDNPILTPKTRKTHS